MGSVLYLPQGMTADRASDGLVKSGGDRAIQSLSNEVNGRVSETTRVVELLNHLIDRLEKSLDALDVVIDAIGDPRTRGTLWGQIRSTREKLLAARCIAEYLEGVS